MFGCVCKNGLKCGTCVNAMREQIIEDFRQLAEKYSCKEDGIIYNDKLLRGIARYEKRGRPK